MISLTKHGNLYLCGLLDEINDKILVKLGSVMCNYSKLSYVWILMACMHAHKMPTRCNVHYAIHVKAMGQLGSLLLQHRSSGSGSSCQALGQVPFSR